MRYPWHALHGQVVAVERELTAADERVFVIALDDASFTHLPVWMTEAAAARPAMVVAEPVVSVAGLTVLRRLLDAVLDPAAAPSDAGGRP